MTEWGLSRQEMWDRSGPAGAVRRDTTSYPAGGNGGSPVHASRRPSMDHPGPRAARRPPAPLVLHGPDGPSSADRARRRLPGPGQRPGRDRGPPGAPRCHRPDRLWHDQQLHDHHHPDVAAIPRGRPAPDDPQPPDPIGDARRALGDDRRARRPDDPTRNVAGNAPTSARSARTRRSTSTATSTHWASRTSTSARPATSRSRGMSTASRSPGRAATRRPGRAARRPGRPAARNPQQRPSARSTSSGDGSRSAATCCRRLRSTAT